MVVLQEEEDENKNIWEIQIKNAGHTNTKYFSILEQNYIITLMLQQGQCLFSVVLLPPSPMCFLGILLVTSRSAGNRET